MYMLYAHCAVCGVFVKLATIGPKVSFRSLEITYYPIASVMFDYAIISKT